MRLSPTRIAVFVLAGLIFLAALILDTTALLELAAYWLARIPLVAWLATLVAAGGAIFAARSGRARAGRGKQAGRATTRPRQQPARRGNKGNRARGAPRRPARRTRPAR